MTNKPIASVEGTVEMSDGSRRFACRNTYKVVDFHGDGSFTSREVIVIEFVLDTNANAVRGRRYRKTSEKQASTFLSSE